MVKGMRKLVIIVSLICLCVSGCLIPVVSARDAFAPSWLKEGTYAKYEAAISNSNTTGFVQFFNVTDPKFAGTNYMLSHKADTLGTISSSFTWRCVSVNDTMAKLQVTLEYAGNSTGNNYDDNFEYVTNSPGNVSFQLTGEAYVDLYTRGVYNADGVFLGTTHLWLPANPTDGQEMILWEEDSKTITSAVTIDQTTSWTTTVQGKQDIFEIRDIRVKDKYTLGYPFYDSDTGLYVGGMCPWDPICAVIGVSSCNVGVLTETNISLGPERSTTNWMQILPYVIIPVAIILLVTTLLVKRRRKKN
jgi:hypothetical protein